MYDKSVGKRIKDLREIHNISQADAAIKSGIGLATFVQIENGRYPVSSESLIKLCKLYGVSSDYILGLADIDIADYKRETRELYQKSYEQYLRHHQRAGNSLKDITGEDPIATWPYNLFEYCGLELDAPISDIQMEGLKHVIDNTLTIREGVMVCGYFMKEMTLDDLAKEFGVTRERIRQVIMKACRKIRHPSRVNFIRYGVDYAKTNAEMRDINAKLSEIERKKEIIREFDEKDQEHYMKSLEDLKLDPRNTTLDELNLSVRSYNCLARAAYWMLKKDRKDMNTYDIIKLFQSGEIIKVRNLGRKSYEEIKAKLLEIGIPEEELTENSEVVLEAGA